MATNDRLDLQVVIKQYTDPNFICQITEKFDQLFTNMNLIKKFVFSKYQTFLTDVQSFKNSLLKFVLEAQAHLSGLMKNMESEGFKHACEQEQMKFIESRLSKFNKQLLLDYLINCKKLIKTSLSLHEEYGTKLFKVKYIFWNTLGFTMIGAAVGFTIGLVIPFCGLWKVGVGALAGGFAGLLYASYELVFKWEKRMAEVQKIRDNLVRIHDLLVEVEKQTTTTYKIVEESKKELNEKIDGDGLSFLNVETLRNYVFSTYDQLVQLEKTLLNVKIGQEEK